MYSKTPKKTIIVNILDILKKYSDELHPLSQKDIGLILERDYGLKVERKAIKRNISDLLDLGYDIIYSEKTRSVTDKKTGKTEKSSVMTDFYLIRDFDDSELRLIIDSLFFNNNIPPAQKNQLIKKLSALSGSSFKAKIKYADSLNEKKNPNSQFFYTIDVLQEAIEKKKKVNFHYCEYRIDKKLHRKVNEDGSYKTYTISPYQLATNEGKYYLICNFDPYNTVSNYRIDRIADIEITDSPIKPYENLEDTDGKRLDLNKYMKEHIYMCASSKIYCKFKIPPNLLSDVIDIFGSDISLREESDGNIIIGAQVNELAMFLFAKRFSPKVKVLSPQEIIDSIKSDALKTLEEYENKN